MLMQYYRELMNTITGLSSEAKEHEGRSDSKAANKAFGRYTATRSEYTFQFLSFVQL